MRGERTGAQTFRNRVGCGSTMATLARISRNSVNSRRHYIRLAQTTAALVAGHGVNLGQLYVERPGWGSPAGWAFFQDGSIYLNAMSLEKDVDHATLEAEMRLLELFTQKPPPEMGQARSEDPNLSRLIVVACDPFMKGLTFKPSCTILARHAYHGEKLSVEGRPFRRIQISSEGHPPQLSARLDSLPVVFHHKVIGILSNALLSFRGTLIDGLLQPNVRLGNGLILEKADGKKAAKRIKEARAPKDVTRAQPEVYELRPPGMAGGGPRTEEHYMQTKIRTLTEREIALSQREIALNQREIALDKRRVALDKRRVELDNRRVALDKRRVALNNKETALDKREAALRKGQTAPIEREGALDSREAQFSLKHRQLVEKQQRLLSQTQSTPNQQTDQPALDAKSSLYGAKVIFKLRNKALVTKRKLTGKILPPVRSKSGKPVAAATSDLESSIQPSISPNSKFEFPSDYDEIFPGLDDDSSSDSRTRIMLPRRPAP